MVGGGAERDPALQPAPVSDRIPFMNKQMTLVASLTLAATLPGSPAFASQGAAPVLVVASVGH